MMPQSRDKRSEDLQILQIAGTALGAAYGGPAGAAMGGAAAKSLGGKPGATTPPVETAMDRRADQIKTDQSAEHDLMKAQDAVKTLPPDQQGIYAPAIDEAMAAARRRSQGVKQWRE